MGSQDPNYFSYGHLRPIIQGRNLPKFDVRKDRDGMNDSVNGAFTNSVGPDDMRQTTASHQGLCYLPWNAHSWKWRTILNLL